MNQQVGPLPNGQRQQRRNRKHNGSNSHATADGISSPQPHQYMMNVPAGYDGTSESTQSPTQNRKSRKQAYMSDSNGVSGEQNFPKHTNRPRHPSQSQSNPTAITQATPVKSAAYAGPTFHASPAASSLPMPKMFSKSVPESGPTLSSELVSEDSDVAATDFEETQTNVSSTPNPKDREPSPLDFLFDAARKARHSSTQAQSPGYEPGKLSPNGNNGGMGRETPSNRNGGMFPFEMEGNSTPNNSIGPAFATPYQDRMNAYRSREPTDLDEQARAAKADGLKRLLGHSPSPKPTPPATYFQNASRPSPPRHRSNPSTPSQFMPMPGNQPRQSPAGFGNGDFPFRDIITQRPPSSKLRQEVSPPSYHSPQAPVPYGIPTPSRASQTMDAKRLEDDLRRVLKLDVKS